MLNYMRAELYRNFNRAYLWVYTGILAALTLLVVIICKINNIPEMNLTTMLEITILMSTMPVYLVAAMLDMVTAEEQKNQTMRNIVTFGVARNKIILSKLIVSVVLALISAFIILTVFYGSTAALLGIGADFSAKFSDFIVRFLAAVPLWIGAISLGTFLAIIISNSTAFGFAYAGFFLMTPNIIKLLGMLVSEKFMYIHKILITTQLGRLTGKTITTQDITTSVMVGIGYTIVFAILSVLYFRKKEIK